MQVFEERRNRSSRRKTSQSKGENQQLTHPMYGANAGIWTPGHSGGRRGECFHRCTIFPSHVIGFCISIFCFALVSCTRCFLKSMFCARCAAYMKTLASPQFLLSVVQEIISRYVIQLLWNRHQLSLCNKRCSHESCSGCEKLLGAIPKIIVGIL